MSSRNKKHLLYIHNVDIFSEQANLIQVLHMCDAFAKNGLKVTLALPFNKNNIKIKKNELIKKIIGREIKFDLKFFNRFTIFNKFKQFGDYFGVKKLLKTIKPDICFTRSPFYLSLALNENIPTIYEIHSPVLRDNNKIINKFWTKRLIALSKKKLLLKFVVISKNLQSYWVKLGIPINKTIVLHDGVAFETYKKQISRIEARKELNLPMKDKIVVYTGSLYPDRNIENIINLAQQYKRVLFIVVGGPELYRAQYEELSMKNGLKNIKFIGRVPHHKVIYYLYAADILLAIWSKKVITINYCSPLKLFEYMAAGRIIVAHAFPTILEVLENNKTAFLVNPDSFDDLKLKMEKAIYEKYPNRMASYAREKALRYYTWDIRAKQIIENNKLYELN